MLGLAKNVTLRVFVWNEGDSAHILQVNVHLPPKVRPRITPAVCQHSEFKLSCLSGLLIKSNEKVGKEIENSTKKCMENSKFQR